MSLDNRSKCSPANRSSNRLKYRLKNRLAQVLRSTLIRTLSYTCAGVMLAFLVETSLLRGDDTVQPVPAADEQRPVDANAELNLQAIQLLRSKCMSCHGVETAEASLRLDSRESMLKGGERGGLMVTTEPHASLLWQSIAGLSDELEMPPKNPLSPSELAVIEKWLASGAHWPDHETTPPSTVHSAGEPLGDAWNDPRNPIVKIFGGQRLDLWSLKPIQQPNLPVIVNSDWARGDLDRFVLARFESAGVEPPAMADRHTLVRRLYFDLTGLPPSLEAAAAFELAGSSSANSEEIKSLVDQLLETEQFGQHWARMWLDLVRYSDSNGFDWDEFRPQAWRFRDYVIRALNADKPFDQFVLEQLAGDELFAGDPENQAQQDALIATGFLRLGPHDNAAGLFNEQARSRDELMTDLVETTGSALLGITLSCCRCHDHKHDPFSQADHFRIRACFAGVQFADDLPIDLADEQLQIEQHNTQLDERIARLESDKRSLLDAIAQRRPSNNKEVPQEPPAAPSEQELIETANESERGSLASMSAELKQAEEQRKAYTHAMLMVESTEEIPATYVLFQGDHKSPREKVDPGVLSILNPNALNPARATREGSSGRRLALAQWITSPQNPLTARVFVNRVWQQLLGRGLVATSGDFGLAGATPDEPELLDWLAGRFVEEGWSVKWLVRTIVLSATYQQAAIYKEPIPGVAHVTRYPRRLTAEQLRDAMLSVSGLLTSKNSGPPEWPDLPKDVLEANPAFLDDNATKTKGWYPSPAEQQHCRSIFLVQKRNTRVPILETFDQPENSVPCTRRLSSIVAPQALSLLNSPEAVKSARRFAERVVASGVSDQERIQFAFQAALQRQPTESEIGACQQLLQRASWTEVCRALLNINEFAYID